MDSSLSSSVNGSKPSRDRALLQLLRPLATILESRGVTEVTINRPGEAWAKTVEGWRRDQVAELTGSYLESLATAMIVYNGLAPASIVSVVLPGGQRGQIVRPPACIDGTLSLSIRKHTLVAKTLVELEREGAFARCRDVSFNRPTAELATELLSRQDFTRLEPFEVRLLELKRAGSLREFLRECVLAKRNTVIAGKTGSGKTTLARSLIGEVPTGERIVTIEDVHELFLPDHPNRVHMLYGYASDRATANECLASCMRMSPDRIFLAELRGDEAWEYLASLNTGHPGSITTTHANSAVAVFERIASLIKKSEVGRQMDIEVIKLVLYTTIDVVLFARDWQVEEVFYDPIFARSKAG